MLSPPLRRSSSWAGLSGFWKPVAAGKEGGRRQWCGPDPTHAFLPNPVPGPTRLTSALGTFLTALTFLGALSPWSSSQASVRESAEPVLVLMLRGALSPDGEG